MDRTTGRLLSAAVAALAVLASTPGGAAGPPATLASGAVPDARCPRGLNSVKDFVWYASRAYHRETVTWRAQRRMKYMKRCQHSEWARREVRRYAARYKREREARALAARVFPVRAHLRSIAQCESGGNPRAVSADGQYRGKYQFSFSTWASVGGRGDPAAASEYEQDMRAERLYRTGGPGHWPVCRGR